ERDGSGCREHDDDERRQNERERRRGRAPKPAADVPEPHRELRRERTGQRLCCREALEVLLLRDPTASLDEVALHRRGERDRSAEAERTESQEVPRQVADADRVARGHAASSNTSAAPLAGAKT